AGHVHACVPPVGPPPPRPPPRAHCAAAATSSADPAHATPCQARYVRRPRVTPSPSGVVMPLIEPSFSMRDSALPPPRRVHWLSRLLWWSAGADIDLLSRCPRSDGVKYEGMGGVVLATGVLAFVSSAYAFYTVFSPKDQKAMEQQLDPGTLV